MNRGSQEAFELTELAKTGFNEAPIHESGKSGSGVGLPVGCPGASMRPRFMNRGSPRPADLQAAEGRASMRPRFMNRGSMRLPPPEPSPVKSLQ